MRGGPRRIHRKGQCRANSRDRERALWEEGNPFPDLTLQRAVSKPPLVTYYFRLLRTPQPHPDPVYCAFRVTFPVGQEALRGEDP